LPFANSTFSQKVDPDLAAAADPGFAAEVDPDPSAKIAYAALENGGASLKVREE
jgi:hypothetical protein